MDPADPEAWSGWAQPVGKGDQVGLTLPDDDDSVEFAAFDVAFEDCSVAAGEGRSRAFEPMVGLSRSMVEMCRGALPHRGDKRRPATGCPAQAARLGTMHLGHAATGRIP